MSKRTIKAPYVNFRCRKAANPARVREVVEQFEGSCPSGPTFGLVGCLQELKRLGYKARTIKTDGVESPWTGYLVEVDK